MLDGWGNTALHLHKRLGLWLQPGGHIDPGEWPADGALREATEELGITPTHPPSGPRLVHVDVHDGGRGHLHLDLEYLLLAEPGAVFTPAVGESQDARWVAIDEVGDWADMSVRDAVRAAAQALRQV